MPSRHRFRRASGLRLFAYPTLVAFIASQPGCVSFRYRPVALKQMDVEQQGLVQRLIRVTDASGHSLTLRAQRVDFPYLWGTASDGDGTFTVSRDELVALSAIRSISRGSAADDLTPAGFEPPTPTVLGTILKVSSAVVLRLATGDVWMTVTALNDREVQGRPILHKFARIDLRNAVRVEARQVNAPGSAVRTLALMTGLLAGAFVIVLLTKESCPFVYVDRGSGPELVGEGYPGAAFRSIERDDLLALGAVPGGDIHVTLRNEARETQFTNRAELMVVDHPVGVEPVATHDAQLILLEGASAPTSAEVEGRDVTDLLTSPDGHSWERDVVGAANAATQPHQDIVTAVLPVPAASGASRFAIDLRVGNTPLVDLVFGRFFAAMGSGLTNTLASGNSAGARTRITNWLAREGVSMTVEVDEGNGYRVAGVVFPTGPAASRRIAIPVSVSPQARSLRVRLRGGVGFWKWDAVRLATVSNKKPVVTMVAATKAESSREGSMLEPIARVDERYNALETLDESLALTFSPPAQPSGTTRSMFLLTTGYYNVHPPLESHRQVALLRRVRDRPGALSQLGLDLVRDYTQSAKTRGAEKDAGTQQ